MMPFVIHSLGDRLYGFWILIGTFVGYYGLLDLGLSSAVVRYVSRTIGKNDTKDMNDIINTSIVIFSIIGLIILAISSILAIFCFYFINDYAEIGLFRKIILIVGINVAIGFPIRAFVGILTSYLRYDLLTYASIIKLILNNIFIYVLLSRGYGILALAITAFFANLLEYVAVLIFSKRIFPQLKISYIFYCKDQVKLLFNYSWKTFIAQLADILRFRVDSFVIAGFLNLNFVTYYAVGANLIDYFCNFIVNTVGIMSPVFSKYEGRGNYDLIRKRLLEVTKMSIIISVFIGASLMFYGKAFILRWMGSDFESSYYVIFILCIPYIIALMQNPGIGMLYGISRHNYFTVANFVEGLLNLILSLILVKYYGIYGVAMGTSIAMMIFKLIFQPIYTCRAINLSVYKYYFETLFITAIKTLLPLLLYFYVVKDFLKADYSSIFLIGCFQVLLFLPVFIFFILDKNERFIIKNIIWSEK